MSVPRIATNWAPSRRLWLVPAALLGLLAGALATLAPLAAAVALAMVGGLMMLALGRRAITVFHVSLGAILLGYAFLGKGFAYLGAPPLYVGEITLALALLAIALSLSEARFGLIHGLLLAFMAWCTVQTLPYIGTYGFDSLRDSATWSYGLFAIAVSITLQPEHFSRLVAIYRRVIPVFLLWVPVAAALTLVVGDALPRAPGSDVPIVAFKGGDTSVHLAAIAAFLLLGLYSRRGRGGQVPEFVMWPIWLLDAALVAALNRAAFLALMAVGTVLIFVRATGRWLALVGIGLVMIVMLAVVDPQVDLGLPRTISIGQLTENLTSLFGSQGGDVNEATKEWRVQWWNAIVGYTVHGPYFWTGKGFGINLADADGFQVLADHSLRAPHSVHLEILARAGIPGLILWIALQLAFGASLLRAAFRSMRTAPRWVPVLGWVFVYWLAALIDGSFDVYIGGPQGGIWFWSVIGLGIAAIRFSAERPDVDPIEAAAVPPLSKPPARSTMRHPVPGTVQPAVANPD
jgi:hypothetical protein